MNIQTAFTLGLIAGENVELKDLIFNQTEKPNPMFSIQQPPPLQFNGHWSLELRD